MKLHTCIFAGLLASLLVAASLPLRAADSAADVKPDSDGFYPLFDGKSMDGWQVGKNADSWKFEDGMLVVHGPGPAHLFYVGPVHDHDFKNFHLKLQLMTFPNANSGVYFHTKFQEEGWPDQGFEAQVNATHKDTIKTGSLYHIADIKDPHHADEKWFLYEIIVKDKHVEVKIDGQTVNEWTQPDDFVPVKGHPHRFIQHGTFALQGHDPGSKVQYRDIRVKPLD